MCLCVLQFHYSKTPCPKPGLDGQTRTVSDRGINMTFSEFALGLSPYISYGKSEADYFTELVGSFIKDAAMDACALLKRKPDTKYRYIRGDRPIQPKDAQFLYDQKDIQKFTSWIEKRMDDTDSYDSIEAWLKENNIENVFVPEACANLLVTIVLGIISPPATSKSDTQLPSEVEAVVSETEVGGAELSQVDRELLQAFHADYDKIIKLCIGEGYAEVWFAGNISKQIEALYIDKWEMESSKFQNLILRSCVIETLGLLKQMCDTLNPNTKGTTITAFQPSFRSIQHQLRNNYVKLHPDEYVGVFPYEALVPDWADGEE